MESIVQEKSQIEQERNQYGSMLQQLWDNGVITKADDGSFSIVDDPEERQSISSKRKADVI